MSAASARAACSARNRAIAAATPSGRSVTRNANRKAIAFEKLVGLAQVLAHVGGDLQAEIVPALGQLDDKVRQVLPWHEGAWRARGAVGVDGMAQAGPAEHVPFAAAGEEMLDQRLDHWRLVLWPADHATDLGQGRIGAEELHHAQHWRADAGDGGAHQRRNGHEAAGVAAHDMAEELVVEQHLPAAGKVFPPGMIQAGEVNGVRGAVWRSSSVPFGGDARQAPRAPAAARL